MTNWLTRLFFQKPAEIAPASVPPADPLDLQRELHTLRLELDSRDQQVRSLQQELDRLRSQQQQVINETVNNRLEDLFTDLAGPGSQILTQANLLENQGKPVDPRDILAVARRMVKALERHGILFEGKIGEQVNYDPNRHTPLNTGRSPQTGQPVTVRFAGASYAGKIIYKSMVE